MLPFKRANILLPKDVDMTKWSVVACDQYTSEPEYWKEVESIVGSSPSTLNLILPELYLEEENVEERIKKINLTMEDYLKENIFQEYPNTMIYLERKQSDGKVREGLMGMVDLEDYSYEKGSQTLIRATEKTVIERIPPRLKVRENAPLELPHIMILIDDEKKNIIESLKNKVTTKDIVYDFDLMENGGHIKGYNLSDEVIKDIEKGLEGLMDKDYFEKKYNVKDKGILLFAMGDGNHSLATAKANYENLKKTMSKEEYLNNPARYALVEIVNLHSEALEFEPIHRVIFNTDVNNLIEELNKYYDINTLYFTEEINYSLISSGLINKLITNGNSVKLNLKDLKINIDEISSFYNSNNNGKIKMYFFPYNKEKVKNIATKLDKPEELSEDFTGLNETFKDYIKYANDHFDYNEDYEYMLITEMCKTNDDCYYYGLRVR